MQMIPKNVALLFGQLICNVGPLVRGPTMEVKLSKKQKVTVSGAEDIYLIMRQILRRVKQEEVSITIIAKTSGLSSESIASAKMSTDEIMSLTRES